MAWFWGGSNNHSNDKDPTKSLDPTLKDFLDSQQPRPYIPAQAPPPPPPQPSEPSPPPNPPPDRFIPDTNAKHSPSHPIPHESLFPDGRYAHLWSTYTPQDTITASTTSTLERIVSARKDRRELLHRAALENCAFEHELQQNCLTSGSAAQRAKARLTLCREESRAFTRCYQLQGKFLQALGYLSAGTTTTDDAHEERIQMHADILYHRMMDYEAAVDHARRHNTPIPPLTSVFSAARPAPTIEQELATLPAHIARKLANPNNQHTNSQELEQLPPHERELAVRAALQEAKMSHLYTAEMRAYAREMEGKRRERQRWMSRYFGEPVGKFVIPDLPPPEVKEEGRGR